MRVTVSKGRIHIRKTDPREGVHPVLDVNGSSVYVDDREDLHDFHEFLDFMLGKRA
jgi:hypothetical protein